jgi:fatty-acyl-CoA synthase
MRTIEQEKVTCMLVVPSILRLILRDITSHRYDVSSLTSIVVGSTTFPPLLKGKAINFFGDIVYDLYASTECGPITLLRPSQKYMHRATVGRTVIGSTIKVINNGIECKPLEVGEIHAKTMTMFSGYTDTNNANAETQMIATGDLGYVDEENYLHFVGRADDVIISGGTNIYPEEIENIINECPGVEESAVIGLADDNRGEIVAAFIVGTPIVDPIQYCRDNLTPYKIPKKIFYVDSIPRNSTGKILRRSLFL